MIARALFVGRKVVRAWPQVLHADRASTHSPTPPLDPLHCFPLVIAAKALQRKQPFRMINVVGVTFTCEQSLKGLDMLWITPLQDIYTTSFANF